MISRFSFPLGRIARVPIRMHVLLPAYALYMVLATPGYTRSEVHLSILAFFAVMGLSTLVHELGHALVGRHHGETGQEILIWPLGGLTSQSGSAGKKARIQVALAGVTLNLLMALAAGAAMFVRDGHLPGMPRYGWGPDFLLLVWDLNLVLAAFNLLPGLPFDGGAAVEPLLWRRLGQRRARLTVLVSGAVIAVGLILFGGGAVIVGLWSLSTLWDMFQTLRLEGVQDPLLFGVHDFSNGYTSLEQSRPALDSEERKREKAEEKARGAAEKSRRAEEKRAAVARHDREDTQARLDRLLDRIAAEGIGSLSPEERAFLNEESRRLRGKKTT